jgi:Trk-type K+ transport system membrane component
MTSEPPTLSPIDERFPDEDNKTAVVELRRLSDVEVEVDSRHNSGYSISSAASTSSIDPNLYNKSPPAASRKNTGTEGVASFNIETKSNTTSTVSRKSRFHAVAKKYSFVQIHFAYFMAVEFVFSLIIYAVESRHSGMNYFQALFNAVSIHTSSGLTITDLAILSNTTLFIFLILTLLGSNVLISAMPLFIRTAILKDEIEKHHKKGDDEMMIKMNKLKCRAMRKLGYVVLGYFISFQVIGFLIILMYISLYSTAKEIMIANGVHSTVAFAIFHSVAAFNNTGLSLFPANLIPYQGDFFLLFILGVQVLFGNTMFPVALRWIVKGLGKFAKTEEAREEWTFLLTNSRQCYTHLFPDRNTTILALSILGMTSVQWIFFIVMDWNSGMFGSLNAFHKINSALFQSISTRLAGFNVFDLSKHWNLFISLNIFSATCSQSSNLLQIVFMYLSSIPTALTLRRSSANANSTEEPEKPPPRKRFESIDLAGKSFAESSLKNKFLGMFYWFKRRNFLLKHALILYGLMVLIVVVEDKKFRTDPHFSLFKLLYECSSVYGTVGMSLGYPGTTTAFAAQFSTFSIFVMAIICLLGRHRGLPSSLDEAYTTSMNLNSPRVRDEGQSSPR